jgi:hypothetical protein
MSIHRSASAAFALALLAPISQAGFTAAVTPPFRGSPCSSYAGWELFTSPWNDPNAPDMAGSESGTSTIRQLTPGAILTGGGNIYHPFQATTFVLDHAVANDVQEVVFQTSTLGNPPDVASYRLHYVGSNGLPVELAPTETVVLLQIPQQFDELYFRWDLSGVADTVVAYSLTWSASAANMSFDAALLDARAECPSGIPYCFGDGTGRACPCGNAGLAGNGCASSVNAAGANLAAVGRASLAADTLELRGSGMPNSTCLYFQGETRQNGGAGVVFGDGLRCVGGAILRLGAAMNSGGASQYPAAGQPSISVRGNVPSGATRTYQAWYRNAATFCSPATFNLSNGVEVAWQT